MSNPIKIGIVGCGSVMGAGKHQPYMTQIQKLQMKNLVEVTMTCDIKEEKRDFVKNKYGFQNFTTRYEDVVNSDNVELVLVLTSMNEHAQITKAALNAGKHVLVENPMGVTLEEAQELVELAKNSPGYLVPAPHVILSKTFQTIWHRLKQGDIGKIMLARARYGHSGPTWGPWFYQSGGGPLFDLGVYNVTALTCWIGPAKKVTAMTGTAIPERIVDDKMIKVETEDNFQILIDFGDACFAVVTTGFTMQKYRSPAIELYGSTGTIQMLGDDWDPQGYEMWQNDIKPVVSSSRNITGSWQIFDETEPGWPWTDGLRHLIECIQSSVQPLITPEHAYHVIEIMLKALEAGRDGQTKTIDSTFTPPNFVENETETAAHLIHDRSY